MPVGLWRDHIPLKRYWMNIGFLKLTVLIMTSTTVCYHIVICRLLTGAVFIGSSAAVKNPTSWSQQGRWGGQLASSGIRQVNISENSEMAHATWKLFEEIKGSPRESHAIYLKHTWVQSLHLFPQCGSVWKIKDIYFHFSSTLKSSMISSGSR